MDHPSAKELAEERTSLAATRTEMAHQRTFAAWLRTTMGIMGAGLTLTKLVAEDASSGWVMKISGLALVAVGFVALVGSLVENHRLARNTGLQSVPPWIAWFVTPVIGLVALVMTVLFLV